MTALHQFVPTAWPGEPVTAHAFRVRDVLRGLGLTSDVYVEARAPELTGETWSVHEYVERTRRAGERCAGLLYQMHAAATAAETFFALPERKIVHYHSVTPAGLFAGWDDVEAMRARVHATQVDRLARRVDLALAATGWELEELEARGYRCPTALAPMLVAPGELAAEPDRATAARIAPVREAGTRWLSAGPVWPHVGHHDVVRSFALFRRLFDPGAHLVVVGTEACERYAGALVELAGRVGVAGAVEVVTGASPGVRSAHYGAADVFVAVPQHEGWSLRSLEALHHGIPVVASGTGGLPDTLAGAALLLPEAEPLAVAVAAQRLRQDPALRGALIGRGRRRLAEVDPARTGSRLADALAPVLGEAA